MANGNGQKFTSLIIPFILATTFVGGFLVTKAQTEANAREVEKWSDTTLNHEKRLTIVEADIGYIKQAQREIKLQTSEILRSVRNLSGRAN